MTFTRTYDAASAAAEIAANEPAPSLGYGWATNFGTSLTVNPATSIATVTEEDGAQTTYAPYVAGASPSWCSGATNYCGTSAQIQANLNQNTNGTWTYVRTLQGMTTFTFAASGALIGEADGAGASISASTYTPGTGQPACPTGDTCAAWTSSASGGVLVIAVNGTGQVAEVFNPATGQTANYAYTGSGCSTWAAGQSLDLCSVSTPAGVVSTYTYDSSNATSSLEYDMLSFTPAGGSAQSVNTYNSSGQVLTQTDPTGDLTSFSYASGGTAPGATETTTVTRYPIGTGTGVPTDVISYQYENGLLIAEDNGSATTAYVRDPASLMPTSVTVTPDAGLSGSPRTTTYALDGMGNILTSTDPMGYVTTTAYNASGLAYCTISPAEHLVAGVACPATPPTSPPAAGTNPWPGATVTVYNAADQVVSVTDPLSHTALTAYTAATDGVPPGLTYCTVDAANYAVGVTCPSYASAVASPPPGATITQYNAQGQDITDTSPTGAVTATTYGVNGLPLTVTDPTGATTYSYNADDKVTQTASPLGTWLSGYDASDRLDCQETPLQHSQGTTTCGIDTYVYDAAGRLLKSFNALGAATVSAYDQAGERYCEISATAYSQGTTSCPADTFATPTTTSDLYPGVTLVDFNAQGLPIQTTNPLGGVTTSAYDAFGKQTASNVFSSNGTTAPEVSTITGYNADGHPTSSVVGGTETTLTSYDPDGHAFCTVSPKAYATGAYQCPAWQSGWITTPPSPKTFYTTGTPTSSQAKAASSSFTDANGNVVQTSNADAATSVSTLDAVGRTFCTVSAQDLASYLVAHSAATYPYACPMTPPAIPPIAGTATGDTLTLRNAGSAITSTTDPLGNTTTQTVDSMGNVVTKTDPNGNATTNCYDYQSCAGGNGTQGGLLYSTTTPPTAQNPSGAATFYTYYPGGAIETTTTSAGEAAFAVDALGDVLTSWRGSVSPFPPGEADFYTYNTDGSRSQMHDYTGYTNYTYNAMGQLTQSAFSPSGSTLVAKTTNYTYLTNGDLGTLSYPSLGSTTPTVNYTYDNTGAMATEQVGSGTPITVSHDADGNTTALAEPNGDTIASAYNLGDAQTNVTLAATATPTTTLLGYATPRTAAEQVASETDTGTGTNPATLNYAYNPASEVGSVTTGSGAAQPASYDPASQVTQVSGGGYYQCYDNAGELTSTSSTPCASPTVTSSLTYDALGDRTTSTTPPSITPAGGAVAKTQTNTFNRDGNLVTSSATSNGGNYTPIPSTRICDTRASTGLTGIAAQCNSHTLAAGGSIAVQLSGTSMPVPANATSVTINLTGINNTTTPTNLTVYATGSTRPGTRNLDLAASQVLNEQATVAVGVNSSGNPAITVYNATATSVDAIVNVVGYTTPGGTGGHEVAIDPVRICDTRTDAGYTAPNTQCNTTTTAKPIAANGTLNVTAAGTGFPAPAGATAVVADVMAIAPSAGANLFVYAQGTTRPALGSASNVAAGAVITRELTIPLNATNGQFTIYNSSTGSTNVLVDVEGYVAATGGGLYVPIAPQRICDTRSGNPNGLVGVAAQCTGKHLTAGGTQAVQATGVAQIPTSATAVVLNLTPVAPTAQALQVVYPAGTSFPVSTQDFEPASSQSGNEVTVGIGTGGNINIYNSAGTTDMLVDVVGYYLPQTAATTATYQYDGNLLRAAVTTTPAGGSASLSQFTYDISGSIPRVLQDGTNSYIYGPNGTVIEQLSSTGVATYLVSDQLGSTRALVNASGAIVATSNFDALGNLTTSTGTQSTPIGFAGGYTDAATGYVYLINRYYDPATGQFLSVDPLVSETGQPYVYTGNDPVNATDPNGECVWVFCPIEAKVKNAAELGAGVTIIVGADLIGSIAGLAQLAGEPEDSPALPLTGLLEYEVGAANVFGLGLIYRSLGKVPPGTPFKMEPGPFGSAPSPLLSSIVFPYRCR